jgi:cell wall-associated NlpC family hydrolase
MKSQIASGVPWIIAGYDPRGGMWHFNCWGDHTLDLPILGRPFVHGIEDCYTLIRKWWWQNKEVKLSEYPRNDFWWTSMEDVQDDLYVKNFETEGFQQFWPSSPADLQPGDVFLFKLASKQYNHGGVFDGNGLIQHHAPGRLSEDTPVGPYFRRIDMWLRRDG